jgi:hypothetical protein
MIDKALFTDSQIENQSTFFEGGSLIHQDG